MKELSIGEEKKEISRFLWIQKKVDIQLIKNETVKLRLYVFSIQYHNPVILIIVMVTDFEQIMNGVTTKSVKSVSLIFLDTD